MASKKDKNVRLWENDFDDYDFKIRGMSYGYMNKFLKSVNHKTRIGATICSYFETPSVYFIDVSGYVVAEKIAHNKEKEVYDKRKNKAQKKDIELQNEIDKLSLKMEDLDDEDKISKLEEKIDKLEASLERNQKTLDRKEPSYKHVYGHAEGAIMDGARDKDWNKLLELMAKEQKEFEDKNANSLVHNNLMAFADQIKFNDDEKKMLEFFVCYYMCEDLRNFVEELASNNRSNYCSIVSKMTGVDKKVVEEFYNPSSTVFKSGVVVDPEQLAASRTGDENDEYGKEDSYYNMFQWPVIERNFFDLLNNEGFILDDIAKTMIGEIATTELSWSEDFTYLGDSVVQIKDLLVGSVKSKSAGTNIMFVGNPGLGKTEGAKALAKETGMNLYIIGKKNEDGEEPPRAERIRQLNLASTLLAKVPNSVILVDEAEDILDFARAEKDKQGYSKAFINDLIENNKVPIIWTANDRKGIHPATLSRIRGVEFDVPPTSIRMRIFNKLCADNNLELSTEAKQDIVGSYAAPIRLLENSIKEVKKIETGKGGNCSDDEKRSILRRSIKDVANLVFGTSMAIEVPDRLPAYYNADLLNIGNADESIDKTIEEIKALNKKGAKITITGNESTGKTDAAKYIASKLDRDPVFIDGVAVLSKYLGDANKNVSLMFDEDYYANRVLVIDDVDVLFRGLNSKISMPGTATSQASYDRDIKHMFRDMSKLPIPIMFLSREDTSGYIRGVDKSIECEYLSDQQKIEAFKEFFGKEAPELISGVNNLSVGDFVAVAQQAGAKDQDAEDLICDLADEVKNRKNKGANGNKMGFGGGNDNSFSKDVENLIAAKTNNKPSM